MSNLKKETSMCLNIKPGTTFKQATRDIVVYKHVIVSNGSMAYYGEVGNMNSSYKNYQIGNIKDLPIHLKLDVNDVINSLHSANEIEIGFHSFTRKNDCLEKAYYWSETSVKCIIPKGSYYINGTFGNIKTPSVVSTEIIYKEILN